jgi:hypothetical protein
MTIIARHFVLGVLVEQTVDNGDGTATTTTFDGKGNVTGADTFDLPPEPAQDSMAALAAVVDAVGPDALLAAVTLAQGLIDARATLDAARTASATTSARSVAAALTAAVDVGKAAAEEATDPKALP